MPHLLFITGKLAEPSLRRLLTELAPRVGFQYSIAVLPITVAALATTPWIARHVKLSESFDRIVLPGLCQGDLAVFAALPVSRGPKDLRDLPDFFGSQNIARADYGAHDIAILAEINHAPRQPLDIPNARASKTGPIATRAGERFPPDPAGSAWQ